MRKWRDRYCADVAAALVLISLGNAATAGVLLLLARTVEWSLTGEYSTLSIIAITLLIGAVTAGVAALEIWRPQAGWKRSARAILLWPLNAARHAARRAFKRHEKRWTKVDQTGRPMSP